MEQMNYYEIEDLSRNIELVFLWKITNCYYYFVNFDHEEVIISKERFNRFFLNFTKKTQLPI